MDTGWEESRYLLARATIASEASIRALAPSLVQFEPPGYGQCYWPQIAVIFGASRHGTDLCPLPLRHLKRALYGQRMVTVQDPEVYVARSVKACEAKFAMQDTAQFVD